MPAKTICLCMIVRDEGRVIGRALRSVREWIDTWVICDTGSTDDTPAEILNALGGRPGQLHRVTWVGFGHNRTEALRLARGKADYILILDADMVANVHAPFKHALAADFYDIRYEGDLDYAQPMLIADRHDWTFVGATHEYLHAETATVRGELPALTLTHFGDGGHRADKYERDVRLLTAAVEAAPGDERSAFYLAQSYRDLGRLEEALDWYERRAALGGWDEERFYALYQAARLREALGREAEEVLAAYLRAYADRPTRLEPLYHIARRYREAAAYHLGYTYAAMAANAVAYPADRLFVEKPIYHHLLLLEYGICAHGTGRISEAVDAFNRLLRGPVPAWVAEAADRGRRLSLADLYPPPAGPPPARANRLVVLVPFHNPGPFLQDCVASVRAQDYDRYQVFYLDDASDDGCDRFLPPAGPHIRRLRTTRRRGLACNTHRLVREHTEADDIVVCLDGDDRLARPDALARINDFYNRHDCWVMYGQFRTASGQPGFAEPFASPAHFRRLRDSFRLSHVRTFRAGLFHRIADQDPDYQCLKDDRGEWLTSAVDAALMYPLAELAGFDRVRYNDDVLYVYNDQNPLSHHHTDRRGQLANCELVARKRPFARIADYRAGLPPFGGDRPPVILQTPTDDDA